MRLQWRIVLRCVVVEFFFPLSFLGSCLPFQWTFRTSFFFIPFHSSSFFTQKTTNVARNYRQSDIRLIVVVAVVTVIDIIVVFFFSLHLVVAVVVTVSSVLLFHLVASLWAGRHGELLNFTNWIVFFHIFFFFFSLPHFFK